MSAETPAAVGQFTRRRLQFRGWRGARPFWAGLLVLLGGFPIMYFPYAHLQFGNLTVAMATTAGAGSLIIGVLLVVLGVSLWFQKHVRVFAGIAAILLALVSIPVANFGGFIIGFMLSLVGGALAVAWAPGEPVESGSAKSDKGEGGAFESSGGDSASAPSLSAPGGDDRSGTSPANGANGRHSAG
ncbi:hypothetical protein GCM10010095_35740 [Streptomyces anthocyanicus]|uniref:Integral membrane protein n=4 Tax=Streptomyces TaxID=1883 RepID=A0A7U9HD46_STRLI|nr:MULTISPECIES: DUF6114 domain-containing protein [Streptomyces]QSJ08796.1 integral membrane protein [Streptomyces lividans]BDD74915.1 hypothetical protein JCM4020_55350 [Streptomyces coelicolor]AIJ13274.1 integral membrane protein [Streptomyces lividans TK24]EOY50398.1 hypothetical protein SLI_5690 [Streptomyces lividans 1326]KKD16363.1 membrane protein [Streptomyces sp. WM6391]